MVSRPTLSAVVSFVVATTPVAAAGQDSPALPTDSMAAAPLTILYGRVQDASTGQPIVNAVVSTGDVFGAVATDSSGAFGIQVYGSAPYYLLSEAIGYEPAEYELTEDATARTSVLVMERGPIPIEGIEVVAQARVTGVLQGLTQRRGGYSGSVRFYDRERLDRVRGADAFQLVLQTVPGAQECEVIYPLYPVWDRICTRSGGGGRGSRAPTTFGNAAGGFSAGDQGSGNGGDPSAGPAEIVVCINGRRAFSHDGALSAMPIGDIGIYEIFGPPIAPMVRFAPEAGHVRIYTRIWLLTQATRAVSSFPAEWGC